MTTKTPWILLSGAFFLFVACESKKESKAFEKRFKTAKKKSGVDDVLVVEGGGKGKALQTNVQKIGLPTPPLGVKESEKIPLTLTSRTVARVIRRRVSRLRYCLLGRDVQQKAGKAIISLTVLPSGRVSSVKVEAPSFRGTGLASCVKRSAALWKFPKFQTGKISHSYPVIFKGQ